jgi:hypothetical protein
MSLILSVGRQRQADLCEFESNLINNEFQASQGYISKPYLRGENYFKVINKNKEGTSKIAQSAKVIGVTCLRPDLGS